MTEQEPGFADDARRYRLDSRIATGGMGEVWRATDTVLGRDAAVVERAGEPGLGLEAGAERRVVGVLGLEQLDRDGPVERVVGGAPHLAHATGGDPGVQAVAPTRVGEGLLGAHWLITASMTAFAIGPASRPPAMSSLATGAFWIITATATWGSSAGASDTNHA